MINNSSKYSSRTNIVQCNYCTVPQQPVEVSNEEYKSSLSLSLSLSPYCTCTCTPQFLGSREAKKQSLKHALHVVCTSQITILEDNIILLWQRVNKDDWQQPTIILYALDTRYCHNYFIVSLVLYCTVQ